MHMASLAVPHSLQALENRARHSLQQGMDTAGQGPQQQQQQQQEVSVPMASMQYAAQIIVAMIAGVPAPNTASGAAVSCKLPAPSHTMQHHAVTVPYVSYMLHSNKSGNPCQEPIEGS
jgi:hypothetical protein